MDCLRCGKQFIRRYDLKRHLCSKNICPSIYLSITAEAILSNYKHYYNLYKQRKDHIHSSQSNYMNIVNNNQEKYVCERCGKELKYRSNYYTHKNKYCKVIKLENDEKIKNESILNELLESKISLLEINYEDKISKIKEEQIKEKEQQEKNRIELELKIKNLETLLNQQQIIPSQNTSNNSQVNIDTNSGQVAENITNITINNYGQEDLSSIDRKVFEKIASNEYTMIQELIDYIHIETACNRNIYIPSHKEKYAMVLKDNKWNIIDKKELIGDLVHDKRQLLFKLLDKYKDELETISAKRTQSVLEYCENDIGEVIKIKSDVLTKLLNNRDYIRCTFETNTKEKVTYGRKKK